MYQFTRCGYFSSFSKNFIFFLCLFGLSLHSFIPCMLLYMWNVELLRISLRSKNLIIMCSNRSHCHGPLPAMIFIGNINCKINDRVSVDRMWMSLCFFDFWSVFISMNEINNFYFLCGQWPHYYRCQYLHDNSLFSFSFTVHSLQCTMNIRFKWK